MKYPTFQILILKNLQPNRSNDDANQTEEESSSLGSLGLKPKPWVKTSLAPGSTVVTEYLSTAGLLEPLEKTCAKQKVLILLQFNLAIFL